MSRPLLSVITITYKDPAGLKATLKSVVPLLGSAGLTWENVVIDSSPELNEGALNELPAGWPLVRLKKPPEGIYAALNAGAAAASGEFIWFLNGGDELIDPPLLRRMLDRAQAGKLGLICAGAVLFKNRERLYARLPRPTLFRSLLGANQLSHAGMLYRKSEFERVGDFSRSYRLAGDYEHHFRCYLADVRAECVREPLVSFDMSGMSSDYRLAMKECAAINRKLRTQLPTALYLRHELGYRAEIVRLKVVKGLGESRLRGLLLPIWLKWNRRT